MEAETDKFVWEEGDVEAFDLTAPAAPVEKAGYGVMVAWFPPPELAAKLALQGYEKADELHITIGYFGKDLEASQVELMRQVLTTFAKDQGPLEGQLGGVGRFPASESSDNKDVIILLADVARLESLREELLEALSSVGIEAFRNHGYTPHMTLAYVEPGQDFEMPKGEPVDIKVGALTLAVAGKREVFELEGDPEEVEKKMSDLPNYRAVDSGPTCSTCAHGGDGYCDLGHGSYQANYVCDLFEPLDKRHDSWVPPQEVQHSARRGVAAWEAQGSPENEVMVMATTLANGGHLSEEHLRALVTHQSGNYEIADPAEWSSHGREWYEWMGLGGRAGLSWAKRSLRKMPELAQEFGKHNPNHVPSGPHGGEFAAGGGGHANVSAALPNSPVKEIKPGVLQLEWGYHGTDAAEPVRTKGLTLDQSRGPEFGAPKSISITDNPEVAASFIRGELGNKSPGALFRVNDKVTVLDIDSPAGKKLYEGFGGGTKKLDTKKMQAAGYDGIAFSHLEDWKTSFYPELSTTRMAGGREFVIYRPIGAKALENTKKGTMTKSDLGVEFAGHSYEISGTIAKYDDEQQIVFGWASVISKSGDPVVDRQGDMITADELEKAAYQFVLEVRKAGEMHATTQGIGRLIESVVLTKAKQEAMGISLDKEGWWIGFKVDSGEVWKSIKSRKYSQFSIHGRAKRNKVV